MELNQSIRSYCESAHDETDGKQTHSRTRSWMEFEYAAEIFAQQDKNRLNRQQLAALQPLLHPQTYKFKLLITQLKEHQAFHLGCFLTPQNKHILNDRGIR